jgi:hypothetical protein
MKWHKLGHIFAPDHHRPWMISHAANPVIEHLSGDVFKVYFSCRDKHNRSHIGHVCLELGPTIRVLDIADQPLLSPGQVGTFDDSGVSLAGLNLISGKRFLYYVGWNLGVTVPWRNSLGLAIYNEATQVFERYSQAPIMDRHRVDPYSISYPFVLEDKGKYRMWYGSNTSWGSREEDMAHVIKYAESDDGIHWRREGQIALYRKDDLEYAISRPHVINEGGLYKMWYSFRGQSYRIGYAESLDGLRWERKDDQVGIDVSESGWDSEMIEYPFVFDHAGERYLLYNGNGYGKTGIGLAVLAEGE